MTITVKRPASPTDRRRATNVILSSLDRLGEPDALPDARAWRDRPAELARAFPKAAPRPDELAEQVADGSLDLATATEQFAARQAATADAARSKMLEAVRAACEARAWQALEAHADDLYTLARDYFDTSTATLGQLASGPVGPGTEGERKAAGQTRYRAVALWTNLLETGLIDLPAKLRDFTPGDLTRHPDTGAPILPDADTLAQLAPLWIEAANTEHEQRMKAQASRTLVATNSPAAHYR